MNKNVYVFKFSCSTFDGIVRQENRAHSFPIHSMSYFRSQLSSDKKNIIKLTVCAFTV